MIHDFLGASAVLHMSPLSRSFPTRFSGYERTEFHELGKVSIANSINLIENFCRLILNLLSLRYL